MIYAQVHLTLPPWVHQAIDPDTVCPDDESKLDLAIRLSRLNVERRTGGPFGAAIFGETGRLVSVGVNRVVTQSCSVAHAEMMAFMTAQHRLQRFRLDLDDGHRFTLATSSQPCCQCYGATVWSGVRELLIGARSSDVEELTEFDEGPLPTDWVGELERRGIAVRRDIRRAEARAVLAAYAADGGERYWCARPRRYDRHRQKRRAPCVALRETCSDIPMDQGVGAVGSNPFENRLTDCSGIACARSPLAFIG